MDFWSEYIKESLQSPWFLKPEGVASEEGWNVPTRKVFVITEGLDDPAYEMLGKMVAALKYQPDEVSFVEDRSDLIEDIEACDEPKIILFFGQDYPGRFGEALHWAGHQAIQTHDLETLLNQPSSKKETWNHLKLFASLK